MRKTEVMTILKSNNGITLIALVITIIVLLILAGVAISMLSGENGILKQAANAKVKSDEKSTLEQIELGAIAAMTNTSHTIKSKEDLENALENQGLDNVTVTEVDTGFKVTANGVTKIVSNKGNIREENELEKLQETGTKITGENKVLIDAKGHSITIPVNFKISSESPTLVTKGMIIEDSEGNQYVWIPVFTSEEYSWGAVYPNTLPAKTADESEFTSTHIAAIKTALRGSASSGYTKNYYNSSYKDVWYGDNSFAVFGYYNGEEFIYYKNGNIKDSTTYDTLYNNMLISVYKNGGFYIGRYEMGIAVVNSTSEAEDITRVSMSEYTASSAKKTSTTVVEDGAPSIEGMTPPISKANSVPYNYITQAQSQMLAEELGKKVDYSNVTSSIMFGLQWDMVCVFIENFDCNNTAQPKSEWLKNNEYSKLWGNCKNSSFKLNQGYYTTKAYSSTTVTWKQDYATAKDTSTKWLCTTGSSDQNSSLNIYDFAGNLSEWTLERPGYTYYPCVSRGDSFTSSFSVSGRGLNETCYSQYESFYFCSSRASLYIK